MLTRAANAILEAQGKLRAYDEVQAQYVVERNLARKAEQQRDSLAKALQQYLKAGFFQKSAHPSCYEAQENAKAVLTACGYPLKEML